MQLQLHKYFAVKYLHRKTYLKLTNNQYYKQEKRRIEDYIVAAMYCELY